MRIELLRGSEADGAAADDAFASRWAALERACPWATVFQSHAFVSIWWSVYRERFEPLLVIARDERGDLVGLLPLAIDLNSGEVVAAGARHAEYQGWLARDTAGEYIIHALAHLRTSMGLAALTLAYLPPGTPLGWVASYRGWGGRCRVRTTFRPVIELSDGSAIERELQRKKFRYWARSIERVGPATFERLTTADALDELFDDIIAACDLRQYVEYSEEPFGEDSLKRPFFLALMQRGLLHATVTRVGSQVVSAQLNWRNGREVLLGLLSHSPYFARSSAGTLHLLRVADALARDGLTLFDLSPGVEAGSYKMRFATRQDPVHSLGVFFDGKTLLRLRGRESLVAVGKGAAASVGVASRRLKAVLHRQLLLWNGLRSGDVRREFAGRLVHGVMRQVRQWNRARLYAFDLTRLSTPSSPSAPRAQQPLADLLAPIDAMSSALGRRQLFLRDWLRRLERGEHAYTHVEDGWLVHVGWVSRQTEVRLPGVSAPVFFPEPVAVLHDFYTHPEWYERGVLEPSLRHLLGEAARTLGVRMAYAAVAVDSAHEIRALEAVGFSHVGTLSERRLPTAVRWTDLPLELQNRDGSSPGVGTPSARTRSP